MILVYSHRSASIRLASAARQGQQEVSELLVCAGVELKREISRPLVQHHLPLIERVQ